MKVHLKNGNVAKVTEGSYLNNSGMAVPSKPQSFDRYIGRGRIVLITSL